MVIALLMAVPAPTQNETIRIDARNTGAVVSPAMFGGNFVYTFTNFGAYEKSLATYRQTVVRYPGGTVTENDLNVNNPFTYLDGTAVPSGRDIRTYIDKGNQHDWRAVFVLPTIRYINKPALADSEIERYVRRILAGEFGLIKKGRTVHFEVGNEFYFRERDISPAQYGAIASRIVDAVHRGIAKAARGTDYRYEVSVQSGHTVAQAITVAPYFKNQANKINFLTFHWYPGQTEIQLGMRQSNGTNQKFSARLNDIANTWTRHAGFRKPYFLSEYNINGNDGVDLGLRNPLGTMSIFAESIRADTTVATIWPVTGAQDNLPAKLFRLETDGTLKPTSNGVFMGWLRTALPGARIINGVTNSSYTNASNFRQGVHVEAFRQGNDTMVVYAFGMEGPEESIRLEFSNFTIESVRGDKLHVPRGSEANPSVVPQNTRIWPKVWGPSSNNATFSMNSSSKYEVVQVVLKGKFR